MCLHTTVRLPCMPRSVRTARSRVGDHLEEWGATSSDVAESRAVDAVLVVSELVANAVKFGTGEFELRFDVHRRRIEIAVTDDSPQPAVLTWPDVLTSGARGLVLVDALAEEWGQQQQGGYKTVWAHLSVPPGSALADGCFQPVPEEA